MDHVDGRDEDMRVLTARIEEWRDSSRVDLARVESTLRAELKGVESTLRAELKGVESTLRGEMKGIATALHAETKGLESTLRAEMKGLDSAQHAWKVLAVLTIAFSWGMLLFEKALAHEKRLSRT